MISRSGAWSQVTTVYSGVESTVSLAARFDLADATILAQILRLLKVIVMLSWICGGVAMIGTEFALQRSLGLCGWSGLG